MDDQPTTETPTRERVARGTTRENQRGGFLRKYMGNACLTFEAKVYNTASAFTEYHGGFWEFYKLSNGGFYMAPSGDTTYQFKNPDNYADVSLSADALGIVACLYTLSHLSFSYAPAGPLYHQLREYALDHPEASAIFEAID